MGNSTKKTHQIITFKKIEIKDLFIAQKKHIFGALQYDGNLERKSKFGIFLDFRSDPDNFFPDPRQTDTDPHF